MGGRNTRRTVMTVQKRLVIVAVTFATTATFTTAAWAGGEPKNEQPFEAVQAKELRAPLLQGEPKNLLPFTSPATILVSAGGSGFDWADGGIGAVAGIGIAIAGTGAVLLVRRPARTA
jgi:hypothetical protein